MISVFDHPVQGGLFGDREAAGAWAPERQIGHWLAFEAALARALGAAGLIDAGTGEAAAAAIEAHRPDMARLAAGNARDGVPVPAFVAGLKAAAGASAGAVHAGATSQDVLDTALALTLREVTLLVLDRLCALDAALSALADRFGGNALMARTRMQAALPISVADRLVIWRGPLAGHVRRLEALRPFVERLQLGGPVGTGGPGGARAGEVANRVAEALGLAATARSWHTDRTALADYASALSLVTGTLGKMGQDIALMAQQGIDEIGLASGGGSSAMAHKSNPVRAELLVTLARFNAAQLGAMHGALVHEQERSGASWMLEWMVLPPMTAATCRALAAALELCGDITRIGTPGAPRA